MEQQVSLSGPDHGRLRGYLDAMRAVILTRQGSPVAPNIRYVENWPEPPAPGPGQALLRTLCSAFNQMDLWVGRGVPGLTLEYPRVSGCDACAVVEGVGPGVDGAWVGRRVVVNAAVEQPARNHPDDPPGSTLAPAYELIGEHSGGMHCERFLAPAANLADVGEADPAGAAAFGLVTLTAYSMMVTKATLRPGSTVLITGIGGGVATAAAYLARWMSCRIAVTSRHQWKLERARELFGAECPVLDSGQDWSKEVRAWTGKRGVDMAVDSSGKATHLNCIKSLARGGTYVTPGATSGPDAATDLARVFWNQLRILGSTMGSNAEFREVSRLFRSGAIGAAVDRVFDACDAASAYERLESAEQFGKLVLRWAQA
jgi:NADPH:quinone reductase-like Zn-dependent oxidoreductase